MAVFFEKPDPALVAAGHQYLSPDNEHPENAEQLLKSAGTRAVKPLVIAALDVLQESVRKHLLVGTEPEEKEAEKIAVQLTNQLPQLIYRLLGRSSDVVGNLEILFSAVLHEDFKIRLVAGLTLLEYYPKLPPVMISFSNKSGDVANP